MDPLLLEAYREVDALTPATPPIAPPPAVYLVNDTERQVAAAEARTRAVARQAANADPYRCPYADGGCGGTMRKVGAPELKPHGKHEQRFECDRGGWRHPRIELVEPPT